MPILLPILYKDEYLVAINKPAGLLVHRTKIAAEADEFALQMLRDQLGRQVYPAHRLDRKTSGVLIFTFDKETLRLMMSAFAEGTVDKTYLAIVRGYAPDQDIIDYALTDESGKSRDAVTHYRTLTKTEINVPFGKHQTSRYSLVEAKPKTGRMHQLRKHFAHIFHPIIGDRPHGCNKQNRFFLEKWNLTEMLLHASCLKFSHPHTNEKVEIKAPIRTEFKRMMEVLEFETLEK